MPVDYSKWDALELSDDSDIEVHPNVDKRSFIRAKQNQIHQERQQRKLQIETLKYERIINDGLIKRISGLIASLKTHAGETASRNPAEVAFKAVMESVGDPKDDMPPPRPEGVYSEQGENPAYSKMMASLLDQVNKSLDEKKPDDRYKAMIDEVQGHEDKVKALQNQLLEKLAELEKEEKKKITSEAYHTGFDSSHVNKNKSANDSTKVELLNPSYQPPTAGSSSAPGPEQTEEDEDSGDEMTLTPEAEKFAKIKSNDYTSSAQFLAQNPQILTEKNTDGILVMAFDAALVGSDELTKQYVHQALLLQYCRALGRDGVAMFFKRITTKNHQAQEVFYQDVNKTSITIKNRAREININRAKEEEEGGVEQIQLHAVEPGTEIKIRVPEKNSEDEEEKKAREIFEGFSKEMQEALESGSLDRVNKVLGDIAVPEAEELVNLFGEANILSVEEQIIDGTTEEGQQQIKDLERQAAEDKAADEWKAGKEGGSESVKYDDPE